MFSAALCRGLIEARVRSGSGSPDTHGFPRLYAAASLKRRVRVRRVRWPTARFPRLYAAASLKHRAPAPAPGHAHTFSAALCRGLIEAWQRAHGTGLAIRGFPRLYAAASLKPGFALTGHIAEIRFPRLYAAASLKPHTTVAARLAIAGFPRLYAAASLKLHRCAHAAICVILFSAALCRGLIEAPSSPRRPSASRWRFPRLYAAASLKPLMRIPDVVVVGRFPRLYAAASLKHAGCSGAHAVRPGFSAALCRGLIEAPGLALSAIPGASVFRGFMPRPH